MTPEIIINNLTRDEKLTVLDLIWRDLAADVEPFASPEWHRRLMVDRLSNPVPESPLPLDQAKAEIKAKLDARRTSR